MLRLCWDGYIFTHNQATGVLNQAKEPHFKPSTCAFFAICFEALRKHLGFTFLLTQMSFFFFFYIFVTRELHLLKSIFLSSFPSIVVDTNDRFLRKITVGQASTEKGQIREVCGSGFNSSCSALVLFLSVYNVLIISNTWNLIFPREAWGKMHLTL